jgi:soluble lytic murein transglycosylase-like protein
MVADTSWCRPLIAQAAKEHGLEPLVVEAVVVVESSGLAHAYRYEPGYWTRYLADQDEYKSLNPRRVSASYGLMQVMYPTARQHGFPATADPELLFVPTFNLKYGCLHLMSLMDWSGGILAQALAAYNGGKRGNGFPPYRNQHYVHKVLAAWDRLKA